MRRALAAWWVLLLMHRGSLSLLPLFQAEVVFVRCPPRGWVLVVFEQQTESPASEEEAGPGAVLGNAQGPQVAVPGLWLSEPCEPAVSKRASPTPWAARFHPCQHRHLYAELYPRGKPKKKRKNVPGWFC